MVEGSLRDDLRGSVRCSGVTDGLFFFFFLSALQMFTDRKFKFRNNK